MRKFKIVIDKERSDELEKLTSLVNAYKDLLDNIKDENVKEYYIDKYTQLYYEYDILKRKTSEEYVVPELDENEIANWSLNFGTHTLTITIE